LTTARVFDGFRGAADRAFYYGHTFCGHPLGAAIAREVLAIYRDEEVVAGVAERHARIEATFRALGELEGVKAWRSIGMIGALDLASDGGYLGGGGWRIYDEALKRGAYLRPLGDTVYVAPPLNIPLAELDELLGIVRDAVVAGIGSGANAGS